MSRDDIARRARLVVMRELAVPHLRITDNKSFLGDLGADSLDMVTLPRALEEEFGIRLSDAEVDFCKTVGTAIDLIEQKLENRSLVR